MCVYGKCFAPDKHVFASLNDKNDDDEERWLRMTLLYFCYVILFLPDTLES